MKNNLENLKNKKIICVFAHPDDEAFGPAGTIIKLSRHNEVQIICVTDGRSPGSRTRNLSEIRKGELEKSCKVLGVDKIHYLKYADGSLNNANYHDIAQDVIKILDREEPNILITFDPKGFTGHLDHIAVCMITTFVFKKLHSIESLFYFCGSKKFTDLIPSYFVHMPAGYKKSEVDLSVDVSDIWVEKINAIKCHVSQKGDVDRYLGICQIIPKEEYFLEFKR